MANPTENERGFFNKILSLSIYAKIFAVVALCFFFFGIFTLGAFNGAGASAKVSAADDTVSVAYRLNYKDEQTLCDMYVNVGAVYAPVGATKSGETAQARVYFYDGDWNNSLNSTVYFANIYAENTSSSYKSQANYNWTQIVENKSLSEEYVRITFTAGRASCQLNEVVFLDEEGGLIDASVASAYCENIEASEAKKTLDAQKSFKNSEDYRYNFSYDEEYILESIHGIELGFTTNQGWTYVMSTDYNSLGIVVHALSFWAFGKSSFGLRLPAFLSTFATFILLFFFGKKLFKDDKWGLVIACIFGVGGLFFSLGRTGTPAALVIFLILASVYFMYLFYANGVDGERTRISALPVLIAGICGAAAFCVNSLSVFPCLISLVLFVLGAVRLYKHRNYLLSKVKTGETEEKTEEYTDKKAQIDSDFFYKLRISISYLVFAAVLGLLLLVLSAIVTNGAFARYYGTTNFFAYIVRGVKQCFTIGDITPYTATNAITPFAWVIPLQGATVFDKSIIGEVASTVQLNIQANPLASVLAAVAFLFCTVYMVTACFTKLKENKGFKIIARAYIGLFIGMLGGLAPYLFIANVSSLQSGAFNLFYLSFIPLAFFILEQHEKQSGKGAGAGVKIKASDIALIVVFALVTIVFFMTMPMCFGWQIAADTAKITYNWTAILSNGYYGLVTLG